MGSDISCLKLKIQVHTIGGIDQEVLRMGNETSSTASHVVQQIQSNVEEKWDQIQTVINEQKTNQNDISNGSNGGSSSISNENEEQEVSTEVQGLDPLDLEEAPSLTAEQIQEVKTSWITLKDKLKNIGVLTFLHLFDHHPDAKNSFKSFTDMSTEDLRENEIFHNHANRVMKVIEKVVDRIDTPETYIKYLTMLGQKHVMYDAEPQYLNQMGFMFLAAIQPILEKENAWNDEVRDAWEQLFLVVIYTMRTSMEREQRLAQNGSARAHS
ncbi:globin-like [Tigriopus californicus]|uniref:globin-like n=1 Tax=Tigriopus californicus TaxID=6832 RepID=UPI0027DA9967|nr:globin-like [Tigriopus californicus]